MTYLILQTAISLLMVTCCIMDQRRDILNGGKFSIRVTLGFLFISLIPLLNVILLWSFLLEEFSILNVEERINNRITEYLRPKDVENKDAK